MVFFLEATPRRLRHSDVNRCDFTPTEELRIPKDDEARGLLNRIEPASVRFKQWLAAARD